MLPSARVFVLDETVLRFLPPLRAVWAPLGQQAAVGISGRNAQATLYCALNLRSGRRVTLGRAHHRQGDFQAFLRRLRHGRAVPCICCSITIAATPPWPAGD